MGLENVFICFWFFDEKDVINFFSDPCYRFNITSFLNDGHLSISCCSSVICISYNIYTKRSFHHDMTILHLSVIERSHDMMLCWIKYKYLEKQRTRNLRTISFWVQLRFKQTGRYNFQLPKDGPSIQLSIFGTVPCVKHVFLNKTLFCHI